jgi:hypothetical protein
MLLLAGGKNAEVKSPEGPSVNYRSGEASGE